VAVVVAAAVFVRSSFFALLKRNSNTKAFGVTDSSRQARRTEVKALKSDSY